MVPVRLLLLASPVKVDPNNAVEATRFIHGSPEHGVPGPWALSGFRIGANALGRLGLTRAWRDRIREIDYADFPKAAKRVEQTKDEEMFTVEEKALPKK